MNIAVKTRDAKGAPCPAQWLLPFGGKPKGVLLYVHGGSFTLEASPLVTAMVMEIAHKCDMEVLMPRYRLAPEHPCPAAVDDILALYAWALEQDIAPDHIVFTGEQAGACIAMASLQQSLIKGLPMPAGMVLFSPLVDLTLDHWGVLLRGLSMPLHSLELLTIAIRLYLGVYGQPMEARNPLASPLFGAMQGLPPVLIQARNDPFVLADSERLAQSINTAGGHSDLQIWPQTTYLWERYSPEHYGDLVQSSAAFIGGLQAK